MRKSVVLIEVIFSIVLFSIIIIGSMKMTFNLYKSHNKKSYQVMSNLKLESTRLFLIKNNIYSKIVYDESSLFYDSSLLLNDISLYKNVTKDGMSTIDICIKDNKICQKWFIKVL